MLDLPVLWVVSLWGVHIMVKMKKPNQLYLYEMWCDDTKIATHVGEKIPPMFKKMSRMKGCEVIVRPVKGEGDERP